MAFLWVLWGLQAWADSPQTPLAEAIISPDGSYELTLYPRQAWSAVEVSVSGDRAVDLGPSGEGAPLRVVGAVGGAGPLWLTVTAALDARQGVTWVFAVDPEVVPMVPPDLRRVARRELSWFSRFRREK